VTTGDGLAMIAGALIFVGTVWAAAWASVRNAGIRAEALRRLGEGAWTAKTTTTRRARS
jgi:hypothetical protein